MRGGNCRGLSSLHGPGHRTKAHSTLVLYCTLHLCCTVEAPFLSSSAPFLWPLRLLSHSTLNGATEREWPEAASLPPSPSSASFPPSSLFLLDQIPFLSCCCSLLASWNPPSPCGGALFTALTLSNDLQKRPPTRLSLWHWGVDWGLGGADLLFSKLCACAILFPRKSAVLCRLFWWPR